MLRPIAAISAGQTAVKLCLQLAIESEVAIVAVPGSSTDKRRFLIQSVFARTREAEPAGIVGKRQFLPETDIYLPITGDEYQNRTIGRFLPKSSFLLWRVFAAVAQDQSKPGS